MIGQPETRRQNIEQQRGSQAWKNVLSIKDLSEAIKKLIETERNEDQKKKLEQKLKEYDKLQKEYRSLTRSLNAMIQINGLGQTLGFLKAKSDNDLKDGHQKKTAHFYLLGHLTHWMHEHFNLSIVDTTESKNDGLLDWILHIASSADYRRATTECLAFGVWLSRFAEAELKDPDAPYASNTHMQGGNS